MTFVELLFEFFALFLGCHHRTASHLYHIGKAYLFYRIVDKFGRGFILREDSGSHHRNHFLATLDALENVEHLRNLEDGTKWATVQALAAIDTLRLVDMFHTEFIFADSAHRASLLAGNGNVHDSVVRTAVEAFTATDTFRLVYAALARFRVKLYGIFGAVERAGTRHTTTTKVGDLIVGAHTR